MRITSEIFFISCTRPAEKVQAEGVPVVKELLIVGLGNRQSRPFLLVTIIEYLDLIHCCIITIFARSKKSINFVYVFYNSGQSQ